MKYGKEGNALRILIFLHGFQTIGEFCKKSKIYPGTLTKLFKEDELSLSSDAQSKISLALNLDKSYLLEEIRSTKTLMEYIESEFKMCNLWL